MVLHLGNLTMIWYMKELFNNIFETNIVSNSYKDKTENSYYSLSYQDRPLKVVLSCRHGESS